MKKNLFSLVIFFFILFFLVPQTIKVKATSFESLFNVLPGINCGIPDDTNSNKCCALPTKDLLTKSSLETGNDVLDTALSVVIKPLSIVVDKFLLNNILSGIQSSIKTEPCIAGAKATLADPTNPNCVCIPEDNSYLISLGSLCNKITKTTEQTDCQNCIKAGGVWTGLTCIYSDMKSFIEKNVFGLGIGLGGLIALLCIIYSAFQLQTSAGNPEKIKKSQEILTSCIMGLMLIIFSMFILKLIGVDILKIPGFSSVK